MIKRETIQDIVTDMKNFKSFISEAEAVPERQMDIFRDRPQKPFAQPPSTQMSIPGLGKKKIDKLNNPKPNPKYYTPDGSLKPNAVQTYIQGRMAKEYNRPGVKLTPEIKARLDSAKQTFANAATDSKAAKQVAQWTKEFEAKHGIKNPPSRARIGTATPDAKVTQQLTDFQATTGRPVDPALQQAISDRRGGLSSSQTVDNPGRPEASVMDRTRAAADARRAGVADAGTATPRPGVRTDDVLDAIRNVPDEPQLPKVTGGKSRVTDRGTLANPLTQADLKREITNRRGRRVTLPSVKAPTGGPSLGSPTASGITPQRAANIAAARSATTQGAAATAQGMTTASRFMQAARLAGRGAQVAAAGMDVYTGVQDAKARGAGTARQIGRGVTRALGGIVGGTVGAGTGAFLGTAGGAFTGPGALVTGTAGAFTGGAAGSQLGSRVADQVFQTVAGATDAEKKLMRQRKRQSQINMFGQGPKTQARTGNTAIVTGRDGKQRVGYLSYKDGKPVYTAPNAPSTLRYTSSNPIERIGRSMPFLQGYYANKDERNRQNDIAKQWRKFDQASKGRI